MKKDENKTLNQEIDEWKQLLVIKIQSYIRQVNQNFVFLLSSN